MLPEDKIAYRAAVATLRLSVKDLLQKLKGSKNFNDFVKKKKAEKMALGIRPQSIVTAEKIIVKYKEVNAIKFTDIAADMLETYGEENFRLWFPALKAGYGSIVAQSDDPELTSMEDLEKLGVETFLIDF